VSSPQFSFTAPSPWIFGEIGGAGTAVSDGYFAVVKPLASGTHTLQFSGALFLSEEESEVEGGLAIPLDAIYTLIVQ
jgi:hypothetical protein